MIASTTFTYLKEDKIDIDILLVSGLCRPEHKVTGNLRGAGVQKRITIANLYRRQSTTTKQSSHVTLNQRDHESHLLSSLRFKFFAWIKQSLSWPPLSLTTTKTNLRFQCDG